MTKNEIRALMRGRAGTFSPKEHERLSLQAEQHLLDSSVYQAAQRIGCYLATPTEVGTKAIIDRTLADGKLLSAPRYDAEKDAWAHVRLSDPDAVTIGRWRVPEPRSEEILADLDLILVPGRAFDLKGNRVGHGQGHYDQMLAGFAGLCIGLAFDWQILPVVPREGHDRVMDGICTESGFVSLA